MRCSYFKEFIADLSRVQGLAGHGITNNTQSWVNCYMIMRDLLKLKVSP